jgi:hypothetical protein
MFTKTVEVNTLRVPSRLERRSAFAARILIIADQWQKGGYGITTGAQAAAVAGCSRPLIDAARVILESQDQALLRVVLSGQIALMPAAGTVRRRVRLIESFKAASPADRVALSRAVGPDAVFDSVMAAL